MEKRKTLLEKYGIPLNHLDFGYIEQCNNAREMEKILNILRSGEEGYYPDLTKCAEKKLQLLKPNSKLFRYEEQLRKRGSLDEKELKPIYDWAHEIKTKDEKLSKIREETADNMQSPLSDLPPMRKSGRIVPEKVTESNAKQTAVAATETTAAKTNDKRIKSTDYREWDKYDPDVEILRMDLEEERVKEEVERKNRLNKIEVPKITEMSEAEAAAQRQQALLQKLSQVEREKYAEERRLYGNECYRAKEYDNAIKEYTRAINFDPSNAARAYNNRAIAYIKQQQYLSAIEDCEMCLKLEPNNIKALSRLADANLSCGRRLESYHVYLKVLSLEPSNSNALKTIEELKAEFGELPPANATRLQISENSGNKEVANITQNSKKKINKAVKVDKKDKGLSSSTALPKDYDLAELIKPNCVVKSKLASAAEVLDSIKNVAKTKKQPQSHEQQNQPAHTQMLLPGSCSPAGVENMYLPQNGDAVKSKSKILIEEI